MLECTIPSRTSIFCSLSSRLITKSSSKELARMFQRIGQGVDFGARIVHAERCTACGGDAEAFQERLGAMRACANGNALSVDNHRNVMGMYAGQFEREDAALAGCIA